MKPLTCHAASLASSPVFGPHRHPVGRGTSPNPYTIIPPQPPRYRVWKAGRVQAFAKPFIRVIARTSNLAHLSYSHCPSSPLGHHTFTLPYHWGKRYV